VPHSTVGGGDWDIACMRRNGPTLAPVPFPPEVVDAGDSFVGLAANHGAH